MAQPVTHPRYRPTHTITLGGPGGRQWSQVADCVFADGSCCVCGRPDWDAKTRVPGTIAEQIEAGYSWGPLADERSDDEVWAENERKHEAEVGALAYAIRQAITELDAVHQPQWNSNQARADGRTPEGCDMCGSGDGSWPCVTRMVADDLRAAIGEASP